jgi:hypothetical protein
MQDGSWYYAVNGQRQGPVSFDQLRQLTANGQISSGDLVWCEGMADWQPAGSIPALAPAPPPFAAPPPVQAQYGYAPAPVQYHTPIPTGPSSQGMAIAGFVCSLIIAPLGLIFSVVALNGMKTSGNPEGKGLAIAGLVIGIVFTSIWCLYIFGIASCLMRL